MEKVAILGASRGLGAALMREIEASATAQILAFARTKGATFLFADFSTIAGQDTVCRTLSENPCDRVFVMAGGGPFGVYADKAWKDHLWAWQVSFLFPAKVVHHLMTLPRQTQIILIGSSVAESNPDPRASSYCAAKHALRGLYASLKAESPQWDIRLFSPGYMDTGLLPPNAEVRAAGVWSPQVVARELWLWARSPDKGGHKVYPRHPA